MLASTRLYSLCAYTCRQYGPLTEDLIAVLLRSDPGARPTAAQVLAIPAVRPYADAYVRRMRTAAERCVSPATPLSSHVDDARTGNDVTSPSPEPHLVDGAKCSGMSGNQCRCFFSQQIVWEERLQDDLFCVEWDLRP